MRRALPLLLLAAPAAAETAPMQAVDLTTVVSPREVCYHDGRAFSVGSVIFVQMPRGCTREATRLLKMSETRVCELADERPVWLPVADVPLERVTEETGQNCER